MLFGNCLMHRRKASVVFYLSRTGPGSIAKVFRPPIIDPGQSLRYLMLRRNMSRTVAVDGINAQANQGLENQDTVDFRAVKERYEHEKQRRLRADAQSQYEEIETSASSRLASLADDPFVDHEALNAQPMRLVDGQEVKVIICAYVQEDVQVS